MSQNFKTIRVIENIILGGLAAAGGTIDLNLGVWQYISIGVLFALYGFLKWQYKHIKTE